MKSLFLIVASVFALSAVAQTTPAKKEEAKPVAVEKKAEVKPSKSEAKAPAKSEPAKAATK
jgi:hypothetical protein